MKVKTCIDVIIALDTNGLVAFKWVTTGIESAFNPPIVDREYNHSVVNGFTE